MTAVQKAAADKAAKLRAAAEAAAAVAAAEAAAAAPSYVEGTEIPKHLLTKGNNIEMLDKLPAQDAQDVEVAVHMTEKVKGQGFGDDNLKFVGYRIKFLESGITTYVGARKCDKMGLLVETDDSIAFAYSRLSAVRASEEGEATLVGA